MCQNAGNETKTQHSPYLSCPQCRWRWSSAWLMLMMFLVMLIPSSGALDGAVEAALVQAPVSLRGCTQSGVVPQWGANAGGAHEWYMWVGATLQCGHRRWASYAEELTSTQSGGRPAWGAKRARGLWPPVCRDKGEPGHLKPTQRSIRWSFRRWRRPFMLWRSVQGTSRLATTPLNLVAVMGLLLVPMLVPMLVATVPAFPNAADGDFPDESRKKPVSLQNGTFRHL